MSKKFILLILCLSILPIALFLIFNKEEQVVAPVELPSTTESKPITIPVPGTTGSTSQQCAVCAQISDSSSKDQCLKDFACN